MKPTGYVPPFVIHPRKNWENELANNYGDPIGTLGVAQETGRMTREAYLLCLIFFMQARI